MVWARKHRSRSTRISNSRFDSLERIVEAYALTPEGKPNGGGRYSHEYDNEGRDDQIVSYNDPDETDIPTSTRTFVYRCDERGNWTERDEYHRFRSDPDWTKSPPTRALTYYP